MRTLVVAFIACALSVPVAYGQASDDLCRAAGLAPGCILAGAPEPQCTRQCNGKTIPCSTPCTEKKQKPRERQAAPAPAPRVVEPKRDPNAVLGEQLGMGIINGFLQELKDNEAKDKAKKAAEQEHAEQREQQRLEQLRAQREQEERDRELSRLRDFSDGQAQLLGTLRGTEPAAPGTDGDTRLLTEYRRGLYRVQKDEENIKERFGEIVSEFSAIGTETQEIIDANEKQLAQIGLDLTVQEITSNMKKNGETLQAAYDTIQTVSDFPDIKNDRNIVDSLKRAVGYIGTVSNLFEGIDWAVKGIDWAVKGTDAWADVWKERSFIKRLPELELQCRALTLDAENNRSRQQELLQQIQTERQRIHATTGMSLDLLAASPLRPAGLGSYVPPLYPTMESLATVRQ